MLKSYPAAQATAARAKGAPIDPRTKLVIPDDPLDENVYRLIPEDYIPPKKEARYKSVHADQVKTDYVSGMKLSASMGPAHVPLASPLNYLKKGQHPQVIHEKQQRDRTIRKPGIPHEKSPFIKKSSKDFIKQNALDNINSIPKQIKKNQVSYLAKKDYGVNPTYNEKRKQERLRDQEAQKEALAKSIETQKIEKLREQGIVPMPEDERLKILDGLKKNWTKLNQDYQRLSLTVDTVPKIARKVNMEQQLKEYEDLIEKFSNSNIHVNFNSLSE